MTELENTRQVPPKPKRNSAVRWIAVVVVVIIVIAAVAVVVTYHPTTPAKNQYLQHLQ